MESGKGHRLWRRRLPKRVASIVSALLLWGWMIWWAFDGGRQLRRWCGSEGSWLHSLLFLASIPVLWLYGGSTIDRAMRTVPRLLYTWRVDQWKLLTVDAISKPIARFTVVAFTLVLVNMSLFWAPRSARLVLPRPMSAEIDMPLVLSPASVARTICPFTRDALKALACSLVALMLCTLRDPPKAAGSRRFRLFPLLLRSGRHPRGRYLSGDGGSGSGSSAHGVQAAPALRLFRGGEELAMPEPEIGNDGVPVWTFEEETIISEYTWATALRGTLEEDPVMWRLEGQEGRTESDKWHGITETDTSWADVIPQERGALIGRRFIAPDGTVPQSCHGWLGVYYYILQHPREDRDRFAMAHLLRRLIFPLSLLIGVLPWLQVFGIQLSSVIGVTSLGGVAAGAALSLAKSEVLENVFAGTLLSAQGHILRGDAVEIKYQVGNSTQALTGTVCSIGSAFVTLQDEGGHVVQIPNRMVLGSIIKHEAFIPPSPSQIGRRKEGVALNYLSRAI